MTPGDSQGHSGCLETCLRYYQVESNPGWSDRRSPRAVRNGYGTVRSMKGKDSVSKVDTGSVLSWVKCPNSIPNLLLTFHGLCMSLVTNH